MADPSHLESSINQVTHFSDLPLDLAKDLGGREIKITSDQEKLVRQTANILQEILRAKGVAQLDDSTIFVGQRTATDVSVTLRYSIHGDKYEISANLDQSRDFHFYNDLVRDLSEQNQQFLKLSKEKYAIDQEWDALAGVPDEDVEGTARFRELGEKSDSLYNEITPLEEELNDHTERILRYEHSMDYIAPQHISKIHRNDLIYYLDRQGQMHIVGRYNDLVLISLFGEEVLGRPIQTADIFEPQAFADVVEKIYDRYKLDPENKESIDGFVKEHAVARYKEAERKMKGSDDEAPQYIARLGTLDWCFEQMSQNYGTLSMSDRELNFSRGSTTSLSDMFTNLNSAVTSMRGG